MILGLQDIQILRRQDFRILGLNIIKNKYFYSMKNSTIFSFFCFVLLIQLSACSQDKTDCTVLLDQKPYMFKYHQQGIIDLDSIKKDYTILQECGKLDSVDGIIFQGPVLAQLLIADRQEFNITLTYQVLIDKISDFKRDQKDIYQKMRTGTIARLELEKMPVELSRFESLRPKFEAAGLTKEETDEFKSFLEKNDRTWNYKQATVAFFQSKKPTESSHSLMEFPPLENLEKALTESKSSSKNCLLYFSGYTCVNARKFEQLVLRDPGIQQLIKENFIYKTAYVDDRQKLPRERESTGEKHMKLQKEKFNSTSQPILYILSPDGKILADWSYEDGTDTFKSFLKKGIEK